MFNTPEGNKVLRYGSVVLIVLAIFLAVQVIYSLVLTAHVGENTPPMNLITVNGTGEVVAIPDIATFSFGVEMTSETVATAQKTVTERVNKAIEIVKNAGIDEKDIKTIGYNIYPKYDYVALSRPCTQWDCPPDSQRLVGYTVTQMIEVKVRDTTKAGGVLGQLGAVEITNVSGISFTIDKEEDIQAEARAKAIADARAKAKKLAKDLGVDLGDVVSFNENNYPGPMYKFDAAYGMGGDGASMPVPAPQVPVGENTIVSNVSITYEIE